VWFISPSEMSDLYAFCLWSIAHGWSLPWALSEPSLIQRDATREQ
jgi:hypothetical protein